MSFGPKTQIGFGLATETHQNHPGETATTHLTRRTITNKTILLSQSVDRHFGILNPITNISRSTHNIARAVSVKARICRSGFGPVAALPRSMRAACSVAAFAFRAVIRVVFSSRHRTKSANICITAASRALKSHQPTHDFTFLLSGLCLFCRRLAARLWSFRGGVPIVCRPRLARPGGRRPSVPACRSARGLWPLFLPLAVCLPERLRSLNAGRLCPWASRRLYIVGASAGLRRPGPGVAWARPGKFGGPFSAIFGQMHKNSAHHPPDILICSCGWNPPKFFAYILIFYLTRIETFISISRQFNSR